MREGRGWEQWIWEELWGGGGEERKGEGQVKEEGNVAVTSEGKRVAQESAQ